MDEVEERTIKYSPGDNKPLLSWPLDIDGPLPRDLFPLQYIRDLIFDTGPRYWKITPAAIRRGLKSFIRKTTSTRQDLALEREPNGSRDAAIVELISENIILRQRFAGIELFHENSRRGMKLPGFTQTLWNLGFRASNQPELLEIAEWFESITFADPERPQRRILHADNLAKALDEGQPPCAVEDPSFARAIVLFASLLDQSPRNRLLSFAKECGALIPRSCDPDEKSDVELPITEELQNELHILPRLTAKPVDIPRAPPLTIEVQALIDRLAEASRARASSGDAARSVFASGLEKVIQSSRPEFDRALKCLQIWREHEALESEAQSRVFAFIEKTKHFIETRLGLRLTHPTNRSSSDLASDLAAADWASGFFDSSSGMFQNWRDAQKGNAPVGHLLELPAIYARSAASETAYEQFGKSLSETLPNASETAVQNWLSILNEEEIIQLCKYANRPESQVLLALLLAYGVERYGSSFAELVATTILSGLGREARRSALHFIQRSSARHDGALRFRRFVSREHLVNSLLCGPLAQIADISVGTTDIHVVGSNIADAVDAIITNLDILPTNADIAKRITAARAASDNTASKAAINFILAPVGMSGHFRRLREAARERLLVPLLRDGGLDARMTRNVIAQIATGEAEHQIIELVTRNLPGGDRLESQHRVQLARYLESASKQLEASVRAEASKLDARTLSFVERIESALSHMAQAGESGSIAWLEAEFVAMLKGEGVTQADIPSLTGDEQSTLDHRWTLEDDRWRDHTTLSAEFYRSTPPSLRTVMAALLTQPNQSPELIADLLIAQHEFSGALRLARDTTGHSHAQRGLRKRVEEAASPLLREARATLEALRERHGQEIIQRAEAFAPLKAALTELRIDEVNSYVSMLSSELAELEEQAERKAAAMRERVACSELLARLLRAGDQNISSDWSLDALQKRWALVLMNAAKRRTHLTSAQQLLKPISSAAAEFAPLLPYIAELNERSDDPDWWLQDSTAEEFVTYLRPTLQQLKGWTEVIGILPPQTRRTLSALLIVFLQFLYERTDALRSGSNRSEIDATLESVIEFDAAIATRSHPIDCLNALASAGFTQANALDLDLLQRSETMGHGRRQTEDFAKSVANAVAADAWGELRLLSINARTRVSEDEVQRIDEISDFASVMASFSAGDHRAAYDLLDGAARAVCTSGHPIHRALSTRDRNAAILQIVLAALSLDTQEKETVPKLSWSAILKMKSGLFRLTEGEPLSQLSRVLAAIFTSAQSFEISDLIWSAATSAPEAANVRSDLLLYLTDQGQFDVIGRLCSKFDPAIKAKMEQMLELRTAATRRPDLIPVADALNGQIAAATKLAPIRHFLKRLPTATQVSPGVLKVTLQDDLVIRTGPYSNRNIQVSITVVPEGIVPTNLQVQVLAEDDVSFAGRSGRLMALAQELIYAPKDLVIPLVLGDTWDRKISESRGSSFRMRFSARIVDESIVTSDLEVRVASVEANPAGPSIDIDSLLEYYPGVGNTPATGQDFIGRSDSLEQLHNFLIASRHPSPVLLTGMRRVGKTSLLQEFHRRHKRPGSSQAVSLYLSISELRQQFISQTSTVSATLYRAIGRALSKRDYTATDHNRDLGERLKQSSMGERGRMRAVVQECDDPDSLADSLMMLAERVMGAIGADTSRFIILIDEAEALVVPYQQGGDKKIELEQLLQSLREVSQTSDKIAIVIAGSNHISAFTKEYKNAFFGSCVNIELEGITAMEEASRLISPLRTRSFVEFEDVAIKYAVSLCAGMPQFMWQLGAATVFSVRRGKVLRSDVRSAVGALVDGDHTRLPFKSYDVLEPVEHMLGLKGDRERDLLWLLLRRVALTSSLSTLHAPRQFLLESNLLELDTRASWNQRLETLVDLKILIAEVNSAYRFKVPLFAEGFRAAKVEFESESRLRRLST